MISLAPIVLFAYRRPDLLARVLANLCANKEVPECTLYVFSDGPKDAASAQDVTQVRSLLDRVRTFARITVVHRETNFGLARNIIDGVTQVLSDHDRVIVLEDDILVGRFFLKYMNDALNLYRGEARIASVTGYCYPVFLPVEETFFIRGAECWSWATWRNRWTKFNPNGGELLANLYAKNLIEEFDYSGNMPYTLMLRNQIAGHLDSWAIRWHASCFLEDMLTLYPGRSLVQNIGLFDPRATHLMSKTRAYDVSLCQDPIPVNRKPVAESQMGRAAFRDYFARTHRMPPRSAPAFRPHYSVTYSFGKKA